MTTERPTAGTTATTGQAGYGLVVAALAVISTGLAG